MFIYSPKILFQKLIRKITSLLSKFSKRLESGSTLTLAGDRDIEWSWILSELPEGQKCVLDFGPGPFQLISFVAARKGLNVIRFDIQEIEKLAEMENIEYICGDIASYELEKNSFDIIVNVSTIEHVGLGRYGDSKSDQGDLKAMQLLKTLLKPGGRMLLTIPVGIDAIHSFLHRVYGEKRLPMLLEGFCEIKSEFWAKSDRRIWGRVSREKALKTKSSSYYYALGLFVLEPEVE